MRIATIDVAAGKAIKASFSTNGYALQIAGAGWQSGLSTVSFITGYVGTYGAHGYVAKGDKVSMARPTTEINEFYILNKSAGNSITFNIADLVGSAALIFTFTVVDISALPSYTELV